MPTTADLRALPTLVLLTLLSGCARSPAPPARDILLVTVDTLRADHVGAYGYERARTPVIDALAAQGAVFDAAYTPIPRTTPGLGTLLTGLAPRHHGSREVGSPVTGGVLLSEVLGEIGYATACVTASGVAGPAEHLDRGFDRFVVANKAIATEVTDRALAEAAALPPDRPKFLWVHYWDPHTPYAPPEGWDVAVEGELCRELHHDYYTQKVQLGLIFGDYQGIAYRALESCTALYDAEIAYTDHEIGRLLEGLRASLDLEEGITVLASDHGENLGEDGVFYEHGPSVHNGALKVPLVLRGRGFEPGRRARLAGLGDVMPTLLDALGLPAESWPAMDGVSLLAPPRPRVLVAEGASALQVHHFARIQSGRKEDLHCLNGERYSLCGQPGESAQLFDHLADPLLQAPLTAELPEVRERFALAWERWPAEEARERAALVGSVKLVEKPLLDGGYESFLFDLEADPGENRNLLPEQAERAEPLRRALKAWAEQAGETGPSPRDEDAIRRLRSLGYTG